MSNPFKKIFVKILKIFIKPQTADEKERVAKRAYELYEQRGRQPGHETEDWLQAESEICKKKKTKIKH